MAEHERAMPPARATPRKSILHIGEFRRQRAPPMASVHRRSLVCLAAVFATPVFDHCITRFAVPFLIAPQFFQHLAQKKLLAIVCRMAKRLEQSPGNENGDLMRRKAKEPCCLFGCQPTRGSVQVQESFHVLIHSSSVSESWT